MFINVGDNDYVNLEQIVRCEFKTIDNKFTAVIYFAKPGGSDRHFAYGDKARALEAYIRDHLGPKVEY